METLANILGTRVRARRLELNLTLIEFAMQIGISRAELAIIESGRGNPKLKTIELLSIGMGISAQELITRPEAPGNER